MADEDAAEGYEGPWSVRLYIERRVRVPEAPGIPAHSYVSSGPGKVMETWTCLRCAALVTDRAIHDASHPGRTR